MAVRLEVGWVHGSSPVFSQDCITAPPGSPHHLPSTPDAWASSRCPTPIFSLVNAGPQTRKKQMRSLSSMNPASRMTLACIMVSFLGCSLVEPKPGSGWTRRLPHHGIWGLEPFPQFPGPRKRACYSAYHRSLVRGFEGTGQNTGTQLPYSAAAEEESWAPP